MQEQVGVGNSTALLSILVLDAASIVLFCSFEHTLLELNRCWFQGAT